MPCGEAICRAPRRDCVPLCRAGRAGDRRRCQPAGFPCRIFRCSPRDGGDVSAGDGSPPADRPGSGRHTHWRRGGARCAGHDRLCRADRRSICSRDHPAAGHEPRPRCRPRRHPRRPVRGHTAHGAGWLPDHIRAGCRCGRSLCSHVPPGCCSAAAETLPRMPPQRGDRAV